MSQMSHGNMCMLKVFVVVHLKFKLTGHPVSILSDKLSI